jgi:hypothetical protein
MERTKMQFEDSSEVLKQGFQKGSVRPWRELPIGKSFYVPYEGVLLETLRSQGSKWGKMLNRKFRVVDRGKELGYEVGRLVDPVLRVR